MPHLALGLKHVPAVGIFVKLYTNHANLRYSGAEKSRAREMVLLLNGGLISLRLAPALQNKNSGVFNFPGHSEIEGGAPYVGYDAGTMPGPCLVRRLIRCRTRVRYTMTYDVVRCHVVPVQCLYGACTVP